jgi:hypothetical protein
LSGCTIAPMSNNGWKVLSHGPIEKLAENLWRVEGSLPGMSLRRVMTIARRADGRLVVHSAIALEEMAMKEIEALGKLSFLLVPNAFHRLDAPAFKKRYPELVVLTPKGARAKVAAKVAVDGTYEDFPPDQAVRLETLRGVKDGEGAMFVRSNDGETIVLNDVIFNMPKKPSDPLGWFFTTIMGSAPGPRTSRLFKLVAVNDKDALREDLMRLADTPDLVRVIVAHGEVAKGHEAAKAIKAATAYL